MPEKFTVIDIETENTGYDIMEDNARILSIQLNDGIKEELYYADSKTNSLGFASTKIRSMISDRFQFVGYNIINFDLAMLKKFSDIEVPRSQVTDISEMKNMVLLKNRLNKKGISLEDACRHFSVNCEHKALMKPISDRISKSPEVVAKAKFGAVKLANKRGWSADFSYKYALDKISGGMAILESYNDFIRSNASANSTFHRYAIGDVISEYQLYQKMKAG